MQFQTAGGARFHLPLIAALAVVAAAAVAPSAPAATEVLTVEYSFDRPVMSQTIIDGVTYDRITMPGCPNGGNPGQPALPATGAQILLPFGTEVSSVEIQTSPAVLLDGDYLIEPVGEPVRLSDPPGSAKPPVPDPAIYGSDLAFPAGRFEQVGTFGFRGYQVLILKLQPVSYVPAAGELSYFPKLTVRVDLQQTGGVSELFRGHMEDESDVRLKVDNPEIASTYPAGGGGADRGYDLLILTTTSLAAAFQPLKNYHDANGVLTEIHTTDEVGSNNPVDVRDYIRDRYLNDGIEYVIIGGDDDVIPAKDLYVDGINNMPGDIYFSCLDGSWNWDNDNYWGEPTDGEGGSDVDLVAEVYVGRACAGNTTEATRFVDKTLWYVYGQHTTPQNVLLVGEYLGFGGVAEWGGNYLDELIDGSDAHGYVTVGFPSDLYNVDTLYERDGAWGKWDLIAKLDAGIHMLNHLGHGAPDYAMHLYSSDILNDVHNEDLCFVYSQTCDAGHFDGTDCWAECMNIKIDEGAFAVVMNARYGYGAFNSTDGPSQRYDREFWDAVFNPDEGFPEMGKANSDSKEDNIYRINDSYMRWCCYELNLFGDPSVPFSGTVAALKISFPDGRPEYLDPGVPTEITVQIEDRDESYVPGSGMLFYRYDGGTYHSIPLESLGGDLYLATLPPADCDAVPEYYFCAEGDGRTMVFSPFDAPNSVYTAIVGVLTVAVEDDFETDSGWTVEDYQVDTGTWERAVPVGSGGSRGDPPSDYDGSGKCYVTGNGYDEDIDGGPTRLISPTYDLTGVPDPYVNYARWFYNDDQDQDRLMCEISDDNGATWILMESVTGSSGWHCASFRVADFVTPNDQIRFRFSADDNPNDSVTEAGLDALRITSFSCDDVCPEDVDGSGVVDIDDLFEILAHWGEGPGTWDVNNDGMVDIDDVFAVLAAWGPCP
ncbi:MAG: hypothetical protein JSV91_14610 [Phycisphaerales bacterium]|nr:MAG: hypothetical protein JSV91_14610 [Phycisphaerales bacterium]